MRFHEYGDPSVIREDEVPRPVPGPGEVLIKVAATSFNPSDLGLRRGLLRSVFPLTLPATIGGELAGTLASGDRVMGRVLGAAADYAVAPVTSLVAAPSSVPLEHAAALPIAGLTAWQAVFDHARVTVGRRVLVNGAGGGVGGFAVQLAKHAGARVIATAGPRSAAVVRELGADEVIDYTAAPLRPAVTEPVDVLLHLVGGPVDDDADLLGLVRPGGTAVSVTVPFAATPGGPRVAHFVTRDDPAQLAALAALVDKGAVRIDIAATRPLTDLPAVHREAEAGLLRGKTLLVP